MRIDKYKNVKLFKLIQLILLILFGVMFFCHLRFDPLLRNNIFTNKNLLTICVFLWAFMLYSLICLIADFTQLEKEIIEAHTLKQIAYLDPLTGLPNRNGCDMMINKYVTRSSIEHFGCATFTIENINDINKSQNRLVGNMCIRSFSSIIEPIANKHGFIGRNSGNDFLLIVENCDEATMQDIITELNNGINNYNEKNKDLQIMVKTRYILNSQAKTDNFFALLSELYSKNN